MRRMRWHQQKPWHQSECTLPETNRKSPWKWMVRRLLSFWEGPFSGTMLVLGRVAPPSERFVRWFSHYMVLRLWRECKIGWLTQLLAKSSSHDIQDMMSFVNIWPDIWAETFHIGLSSAFANSKTSQDQLFFLESTAAVGGWSKKRCAMNQLPKQQNGSLFMEALHDTTVGLDRWKWWRSVAWWLLRWWQRLIASEITCKPPCIWRPRKWRDLHLQRYYCLWDRVAWLWDADSRVLLLKPPCRKIK